MNSIEASHGLERPQRAFHLAQTAQRFDAPPTEAPAPGGSQLVACVEDDPHSCVVLAHARRIGDALGLPVLLASVLEAPRHSPAPADPLEWLVRRRACQQVLERASARADSAGLAGSLLLTGHAGDELNGWAKVHPGALLALGTGGRADQLGTGGRAVQGAATLGATAQHVFGRGSASLLLVPPDHGAAELPAYRRLMVPLDGSCRAESVLPVAVRLARASGAELILVHVVPPIELVDAAPGENEAGELSARLVRCNAQRADSYLEGLRSQLAKDGVKARVTVVPRGDPRDQLRQFAVREAVDLLVLAAHGRTGLEATACGSVTEYLATHAPAPLLIIRKDFMSGSADERLVVQARVEPREPVQ